MNKPPTPRKSEPAHRHPSSGPPSNSGKMNIPPGEENISSPPPSQLRSNPVYIPPPPADSVPAQSIPSQPASPPPQPQSSASPQNLSNPHPPLRISSQPMDAKAAQVQALFADQTDGQLTQGSAAQIHALANAPVALPSNSVHPAMGPHGQLPPEPSYNVAQYTPSAQEAATGAYSAQKQQQTPTRTPPPVVTQPAAPLPQIRFLLLHKRNHRKSGSAKRREPNPSLRL